MRRRTSSRGRDDGGRSRAPAPASSRARPRAACGSRSAYARQRLAVGLGEQPPSKAGVEDDRAGTLEDAGADDRGVRAERVLAQDVDELAGGLPGHAAERLPFVCHVQRIDAEDLAGGAHRVRERHLHLVQHHADAALLRHLVQRAGEAAARRVFHRVDAVADRVERGGDERVDRRDVGAEGAPQREAVPRRPAREAVVADRAGDDDLVAGTQRVVAHDAPRHADAGRVDHDAVDLAAAHDFRVARDHDYAGLGARGHERRLDRLEQRHVEAFLEDHAAGEAERARGAHHRQVVHRAGDGDAADVAAGEDDRLDDVRVGGDDEELVAERDRGAVVHRAEADAVERHRREVLDEELLDQRAHGAPAAALLQRDAASHAGTSIALRSGTPPYRCQILHVPSFETMHAPTGVSGTHSLLKRRQSYGLRTPAMMSPQMHCCARCAGAESHSRATSISKRLRASTCANSSRRRRLPFGTWAMPRQRPPIVRKTRHSSACAAALPSRVTQRGKVLTTRGVPSLISATSSTRPARMSSGSKPATTTGSLCRSTNGSKTAEPVIVAAWPAARNPSTRDSGISATISITGGMYLCAERTEKFFGGSSTMTAAVATAVVSKPVAKKTTCSSGCCRAGSPACRRVETTRHFPPASASDFTVPGTLSMSPYVAMRTPSSASTTPSSTSGTSVTQTGPPGPMLTVSDFGKSERSPNFAMACSWLPQTCMTATGRAMSSIRRCSVAASERALAASRKFSGGIRRPPRSRRARPRPWHPPRLLS